MVYRRAQCLIFIREDESCFLCGKMTCPGTNRESPAACSCYVRGFSILSKKFAKQHRGMVQLLKKNLLPCARNKDVSRLCPPDTKLEVYEVFLDESPLATLNPLSVSVDHLKPGDLRALFRETNIKLTRRVCSVAEVRPAVDAGNRVVFNFFSNCRFRQKCEGENFTHYYVDCGILHVAASRRQEVLLRVALANGVEVDGRAEEGYTPLRVAAAAGYINLVSCLLAYGASPNATDHKGATPLHAATRSTANIVEILLDNGADPEAKTHGGWTPLHMAASVIYSPPTYDIVKFLLTRGAVVDSRDASGQTPLHVVFQSEILRLLLKAGADANALDNNGETPIVHAARNEGVTSMRILLEYKAEVNVKSKDGVSVLELMFNEVQAIDTAFFREVLVRHFRDPKVLWDTNLYYYFERVFGDPDVWQRLADPANFMLNVSSYSTHLLRLIAMREPTGWHVWYLEDHLLAGGAVLKLMEECEEEYDIMKVQRLSGTNISVLNLMDMTDHQIHCLLRNQTVLNSVLSRRVYRNFPIYRSIIAAQFKNGFKRTKLQDECLRCCDLLAPGFRLLPDEVKEMIFAQLSTADLLNVTRAAPKRPSNGSH